MWVIGLIVFFIGIILIISYPISKGKNKRCSAKTQGTLIDILETDNSQGTAAGSVHVYSYYVNGIEYQIRSTAINKEVNQAGDHCTIWYNPAKPKEAQEFHYDSNKVYTLILIVGIVMVLFGIILTLFGAVQSSM